MRAIALLVAPLHNVTLAGAVTVGVGLTVIEKLVVAPLHEIPPPVNTEVTVIFPVMGAAPPLVTTKGAMVPVPLPNKPMEGLEFTQVYELPVPANAICDVVAPAHSVTLLTALTVVLGLTVILNSIGAPVHVTLFTVREEVTET